ALAEGDMGRAVYLSGRFHVLIAGIAAQETIAAFIRALVARSSLIVALYWRRRDALCARCAHGALAGAMARGDAPEAEALMRSHLTDLMSGLDLTPRARAAPDLASALSEAP
ncbi:MAG: FCD domain-containing protein, partial [Alphaproteobacteria bacterium]|nr:FCD domain-containing protein [Alphaproteobacteria bacterium]